MIYEVGVPGFLLRALSPEQREAEWECYCAEHGTPVIPERLRCSRCNEVFVPKTVHLCPDIRAPAPAVQKPDLRAENDRAAAAKRIEKMKIGFERKAAETSGALKAMPLEGKAALKAIRKNSRR